MKFKLFLNFKVVSLVLIAVVSLAVAELSQAESFSQVLAKVNASKGQINENQRFEKFLKSHWDYVMEESPEFASAIGYPGLDDKWGDYSLKAVERRKQESAQTLKTVSQFDRAKLSPKNKTNYDILKSIVQNEVRGSEFPNHFLSVGPLSGPQQELAATLDYSSRRTVKDYQNLLARLKGVPQVFQQFTEILTEGLKQQITPPKVILRNVGDQIKNQMSADVDQAPMLIAFKEFPKEIPLAEQTRLRSEAKKVFQDSVVPALKEFHEFFVNTYVPKCRESTGISDLKNGKEWYQHRIAHHTTTNMSAEEIHNLGLAEVKRIRGEMDQLIADVKFRGDFKEFSKFLRTDKQFFFTSKEDLLVHYRDIAKRIDPELPKLFGRLPRLTYGVIPVPSYAEKSQTTAYYMGGSTKSGRAGYFYANTYNLESRPKWEMEALTAHEAVPGHHFQIAISEELEGLPNFRQHGLGGFTAFVEGWGLYAESLGDDLGLYKDPHSRFGKLSYEIWRAIRLVVDTGIHAKGWSREKAIEFFATNSPKPLHDIEVEVDRYISWAGQALAYKVGELKFKELKAQARKTLGGRFDIRKFHDVVLQEGALPLALVEKNVNAWVATNVASPGSSKGR